MSFSLVRFIIIFTLLAGISAAASGQTAEQYLEKAKKASDELNDSAAMIYYEKAAALNNPEAMVTLASTYEKNREQAVQWLTKAADMGSKAAVRGFFDLYVFECDSEPTNPDLAYKIYKETKAKFPQMTINDSDKDVIRVMHLKEAGPFDFSEFIDKYNIEDTAVYDMSEYEDIFKEKYFITALAEEASKRGRFGPPNPKLVFQLVNLHAQYQMDYSVFDDTYKSWKQNDTTPFCFCSYVITTNDMSECAYIEYMDTKKELDLFVSAKGSRLKNNAGIYLKAAATAADTFFETHANDEVLQDGREHSITTLGDITYEINEFTKLVRKIDSGHINPDTFKTDKEADKKLNQTYRYVKKELTRHPRGGWQSVVDQQTLKETQLLWLKYRDAAAKLYSTIDPRISEQTWKDWLTEKRTKQIKEILDQGYNDEDDSGETE